MKKKFTILVLVLLTSVMMLPACSEPPAPSEEITDTANIEDIEVQVRGEVPKQVQVVVEGELPDGCTKINDITTERREYSFEVEITTLRTTGVECSEESYTFTEEVSLPVNNLPAGEYAVIVEGANSMEGSFEFTEDNVMTTASTGGNATVEDLQIDLMEDAPDRVKVTVIGKLKDPCTEMEGIEYELEDGTFLVHVKTAREAHTMCNSQAAVPFDESVELDVSGLEAGEYVVESQDVTATFELP